MLSDNEDNCISIKFGRKLFVIWRINNNTRINATSTVQCLQAGSPPGLSSNVL